MKNTKEKGITLIALVVTIIILLILAGVTLKLIAGDNGIFNKTQKASEATKFANEKEAIEMAISNIKIGLITGEEISNNEYLGEALSKRTMSNTSDWKIVVAGGKNYSNGWYLLEEGKEIPGYGKANENWLINYDTEEIIKLEKENYEKISSNDEKNQIAKENLIFDLDGKLLTDAKNEDGIITESSFQNVLDENSELINFNWSEPNSGVTKSSFMFDGEDDYIKVKYDDSLAFNSDGSPYEDENGIQMTKKQLMKEKGFTFEYYGKFDEGKSYKYENNEWKEYEYDTKGIFGYWDGDETKQNIFRFCIINKGTGILWNYDGFYGTTEKSDFSVSNTILYNQRYDFSNSLYDGNPHYLVVTIDTSKIYKEEQGIKYYREAVYLDGKLEKEGGYPVSSWNLFVDELDDCNYFCIGKSSQVGDGYWHYSKMDCYALRLYNRGLTNEEVEQSYSDTKKYHQMLENE